MGRLLHYRILPALPLLNQVALAIAIFLDRLAGCFDGGEEILDCVSTFLADLVTELEALDFTNTTDADSILVGAASIGARRRHDAPGIIVLRRLFGRIFDDILRQAMRPLFRVLLPDIASNSSQLIFLAKFLPERSRAPASTLPAEGKNLRRVQRMAGLPRTRTDHHQPLPISPGIPNLLFCDSS